MRRCLTNMLAAAVLSAIAWAQGSGNVPLAELGTADPGSDSAFLVTRTLKGKVAAIQKADRLTIVVVEDGQGHRGALTLNAKTRFKADKGTEYAGKKRLSSEDIEVGQLVKVTFVPDTGRVVELRFAAKA